jgi:hypothetical protein
MDRSIKAGVFGFILVILVDLFLPEPAFIYFVPPFVIAILVIYTFRLGTLKDGLVAAFMTYIFSEGIIDTIGAADLYLTNQPYPPIDIWAILYPTIWAVSAVIAGYIGVRLAQKRKPAQELPLSPPPQLPPV